MESDFSIRNELDSVVRGSDSDANHYKEPNPFSKLVDNLNIPSGQTIPPPPPGVTPNEGSWREQAYFASAVSKQQADIAHRAIDLMHRQLFESKTSNYWKYATFISVGVLVVVLILYIKSNVKLRFVSETNSII